MKETGWSDDDDDDEDAAVAAEDRRVRVLQSPQHHESFLLQREVKPRCRALFLCRAVFNLIISVSLWFVFRGESPRSPHRSF